MFNPGNKLYVRGGGTGTVKLRSKKRFRHIFSTPLHHHTTQRDTPSRFLHQEQKWLHPGAGSWGPSLELGQWQCAASVLQTSGCLGIQHWCHNPGGKQNRIRYSSGALRLCQGWANSGCGLHCLVTDLPREVPIANVIACPSSSEGPQYPAPYWYTSLRSLVRYKGTVLPSQRCHFGRCCD